MKPLKPPMAMRDVAQLLGWIDEETSSAQARVAAARALRMLRRIQRDKQRPGDPRLLFRQKNCKSNSPWLTTEPLLRRYCGEMLDRREYIDRQLGEMSEKFLDDLRTLKQVVSALGARLRKLEQRVADLDTGR